MSEHAPDEATQQPTLVTGPTSEGPVDVSGPPLENLDPERRYELGATIGRGGMGEVRYCHDVVLRRHLAMKLASTAAHGSHNRFVREARVQGQLEHPAIVPVHDLGVRPDGTPYFTMKRVRGVTLEDVLNGLHDGDPLTREKFSRRRLLTAFQSVCLAIDFAHARRVLHRDLKPANIMLGDYGEVYVLDWGLAKRLDDGGASDEVTVPMGRVSSQPVEPGQTEAGSVLGTPGYMAPEQVTAGAMDERTDVFALGAILFELLTLEPLVPQDSVVGMMEHTAAGVDARARERAPQRDVPPELEAVCLKATALHPGGRYQTARALHDAVDAFVAGERDEELRASLAQKHAEAAERAARRALEGGEGAMDARTTAFREIGQALAVDPQHPTALKLLVRLLGATRGAIPPGARAELDAAASRQTKVAGRLGALGYLAIFLYLPLLWWMGVRNGAQLTTVFALVLASAAGSWFVGAMRTPRPVMAFIPFVASTLMTVSLSFLLGPFIFLPSFAAVNAVAFAVLLERRHRVAAVVLGTMGVVLAIGAEVLGLVPNPMKFSEAGLTIAPQAVALPEMPTMLLLSMASVGTIALAAYSVARLRDALHEAEERLVVQSWNLRQLLPPEATAATTGEHPIVAG
jgi:serine/threonine-protein kinase